MARGKKSAPVAGRAKQKKVTKKTAPKRAAKKAPARKASAKSVAPKSVKYVYAFGGGRADGSAKQKNLLGGKGANLAEMASLGLPVPPGFSISTELCTYYYGNGRQYPETLDGQVRRAIAKVEKIMGK